MNEPKRQHWVPRMYLRAFATPDTLGTAYPEVWCFGKEGGDPFRASIKHVTVQEYLYSPKKADGSRSFEMENLLAKLEGGVAPLWQAFAEDEVDFEQLSYRRILALFIATLYLRNPNRLASHRTAHKQVVDTFGQLPRDESGNPAVQEIIYRGRSIPFDNSEWKNFANADETGIREMFVSAIPSSAVRIATMLIEKRWSVLWADTPGFITCDDPVVLLREDLKGVGIFGPDVMIHIPISPTRVLVLDDRHSEPANQYYLVKPGGIPAVNLLSWRNAKNFMIAPRDTDDVIREIVLAANAMDSGG